MKSTTEVIDTELKVIIDESRAEEVIVYAHSRSEFVEEIERLISECNIEIVGYKDAEAYKLDLFNINCFVCENNRVYALSEDRFLVKLRLYQLEERLDKSFIKINQSCIANVRQISKVEATFSGALSVVFKNGYRDYISRRNLKKVKERLGVKL
jgi:DNA-binding LytR/AlgR family response regulator